MTDLSFFLCVCVCDNDCREKLFVVYEAIIFMADHVHSITGMYSYIPFSFITYKLLETID